MPVHICIQWTIFCLSRGMFKIIADAYNADILLNLSPWSYQRNDDDDDDENGYEYF